MATARVLGANLRPMKSDALHGVLPQHFLAIAFRFQPLRRCLRPQKPTRLGRRLLCLAAVYQHAAATVTAVEMLKLESLIPPATGISAGSGGTEVTTGVEGLVHKTCTMPVIRPADRLSA